MNFAWPLSLLNTYCNTMKLSPHPKKRSSRAEKDNNIPTRKKIEDFFKSVQAGENGARPFVHNDKGENMDWADWFTDEIWDRGLRDLLGEYTHVVLKDLNELATKYLWRPAILADMAARRRRNNELRGDEASKLRVSPIIRGEESGPLKSLKERSPRIYEGMKSRRLHIANVDTLRDGDVFTEFLETLLEHCKQCYADGNKVVTFGRAVKTAAGKNKAKGRKRKAAEEVCTATPYTATLCATVTHPPPVVPPGGGGGGGGGRGGRRGGRRGGGGRGRRGGGW